MLNNNYEVFFKCINVPSCTRLLNKLRVLVHQHQNNVHVIKCTISVEMFRKVL